jgi:hypothetical protein
MAPDMDRFVRPPSPFGALLVLAAGSLAAPAAAQPAAQPPASAQPAPSAPPPARQRAQPAVVTIAEALAETLPKTEGRVVVAVSPLESDAKAPRGDALAVLVASQLAGRRGWESPGKPEPLGAAIGRARKASAVVFVKPRIAGGRLLVSADVHPVPSRVWARIRHPNPGPIAHAFSEAPIDAEVRSFLEPVPLVAPLEVSRGQSFEGAIIALACADLDRDGANEIVSVSADRVTHLRVRGGKVHPIVVRPWRELSPMDPTPIREPIAVAFSVPFDGADTWATRDAVVSITDRLRSVRLGVGLEVVTAPTGFAIPEGGAYACARFPAPTVTGPLERCGDGEPEPGRTSVGGRYDAFSSAKLVGADGKPFEVWAGREDGVVEIFDDAGNAARIAKAGAQLAVGDLNQDGTPEILTSLDVDRGTPDAVVVYSWSRTKKAPEEKLRMPVAAGVQAIAVCAPDGPGRAGFVAATPAEILVAK